MDPPSSRATVWTGLLIFAVILVIYIVSNFDRVNFYNHFVWQASAWLEGQAGIRFPVSGTANSPGNDYFQDVQPILDAAGNATGRALIPFPPLPAVILLPFVALLGLTTNAQLIATFIGAIDVGLAFWMLGRLPLDRRGPQRDHDLPGPGHRPVVRRRARLDLVPGPRRGRRADPRGDRDRPRRGSPGSQW